MLIRWTSHKDGTGIYKYTSRAGYFDNLLMRDVPDYVIERYRDGRKYYWTLYCEGRRVIHYGDEFIHDYGLKRLKETAQRMEDEKIHITSEDENRNMVNC